MLLRRLQPNNSILYVKIKFYDNVVQSLLTIYGDGKFMKL
jgi:hypothetical protein